uniref:Uncharacterized protein n=1 Tax=Anopheles albimanus TaxID=7167 RepID=A0A182FNC3_ANOAL
MSAVPVVSIDTVDSCAIDTGVQKLVPGTGTGSLVEDEGYKKLFSNDSGPLWPDPEDPGVGVVNGFLNSTLISVTSPTSEDREQSSVSNDNSGSASFRRSAFALFGSGTDDDYKGGLLTPESQDSGSSGPASITSRPSDSSRGFQNTFTVLERHLQSKHFQFRQLRRFLQYNESNQQPVFCNLPPSLTNSSNYLSSISEESGATATTIVSDGGGGDDWSSGSRRRSLHHEPSDEEDHEKPSFLELELEASDRLRRLKERLGGSVPNLRDCGTGTNDKIESPLAKALYGISLESLAKTGGDRIHPNPAVFIDEEEKRSQSGEYPDYPYYVARAGNGQQYLKVVRSGSHEPNDKGRSREQLIAH